MLGCYGREYSRTSKSQPAQDFAGVTCTDDSLAGARKEDKGSGRAAALTYWRLEPTKVSP